MKKTAEQMAEEWLSQRIDEMSVKDTIPWAISDAVDNEHLVKHGMSYMLNRDITVFEKLSDAGKHFLFMLSEGVLLAPKTVINEDIVVKEDKFRDAPQHILDLRYKAIHNPSPIADAYEEENFKPRTAWEIWCEFKLSNNEDPGAQDVPVKKRDLRLKEDVSSYVPLGLIDSIKKRNL